MDQTSLFGDPGMGAIPASGATLHPRRDRFVFALFPDAAGLDSARAWPRRLIVVENFREELRRLTRPGE